MFALLRIINALTALLTGWTIVLGSLGAGLLCLWYGLGHIPWLGIAPVDWPQWYTVGKWMFIAGAGVVGMYSVFYLLSPPLFFVKRIFPGIVFDKAGNQLPLTYMVEGIANRMRVTKPTVYIMHCSVPNAFAVSKFYGSQLIFSSALLGMLTRDEIEWVTAHELSHIKHYDAMSGAFWVASVAAMSVGWYLHLFTRRLVLLLAHMWRMPAVLTSLVLLPLTIIAWSVKATISIANIAFRFIDRYIGRQMEYRCDYEATLVVGRDAGLTTLSKLNGGIESVLDQVFASHPSTARRLHKVGSLPAARMSEAV